jgi:hypothetical protein
MCPSALAGQHTWIFSLRSASEGGSPNSWNSWMRNPPRMKVRQSLGSRGVNDIVPVVPEDETGSRAVSAQSRSSHSSIEPQPDASMLPRSCGVSRSSQVVMRSNWAFSSR